MKLWNHISVSDIQVENGVLCSTPICVSPPCVTVTYKCNVSFRARCTIWYANLETFSIRCRKHSTSLASHVPAQSRTESIWYAVLVVQEPVPPTFCQAQTNIYGYDAGHDVMGCRHWNGCPRTTVIIKGMGNWKRIHKNKFDAGEIVILRAQSPIHVCDEVCSVCELSLCIHVFMMKSPNISSLYEIAAILQNTLCQDEIN